MKKEIIIGSTESAFYHEAGHVAAAVSCGAAVRQAFVDITVPRMPTGQTSITANKEQKIIICLGGAAAELYLLQEQRYRFEDGRMPTAQEIVDKIDEHVAQDIVEYVEALSKIGTTKTPDEARIFFIEAAHNLIPQLDWQLVEDVADAMSKQAYLEQDDLNRIITARQAALSARR